MSDYNHTDDAAVAKSGKSKNSGWGLFVWSGILFILGFLYGVSPNGGGNIGLGFAFGYVSAGFPWGWRGSSVVPFPKLTFHSNMTKGIQSMILWAVFIWLRFLLACLIGLVELPRGIITAVSAHKNRIG